jgi:hypothetical protein
VVGLSSARTCVDPTTRNSNARNAIVAFIEGFPLCGPRRRDCMQCRFQRQRWERGKSYERGWRKKVEEMSKALGAKPAPGAPGLEAPCFLVAVILDAKWLSWLEKMTSRVGDDARKAV